MIDSENELNRLYKATCDENAVRKGDTDKVAEIEEKPAPRAKKEKAPKQKADKKLNKRLEEKFDIEIEEKQARIDKIKREAEMSNLKQMKLTGRLIPTDLVFGTIRQLSQSVIMSFKNQLEAIVTDIAKVAKLDRKQTAELRARMREHLNEIINSAVDSAQQNIDNIVKEYSEGRKAA
jgi:hypothetical protein